MKAPGRVFGWAVAWLVAGGLLASAFRAVDWQEALAAAAEASPFWLVAALSLNLSVVALWACQWSLFLPRPSAVPYPLMLRITAVMAMTANSVPYGAGHVAGWHLLATRGGVGHASAFSVITLDQTAEGVAKVTLLVLAASLVPLPGVFRAAFLVLPPAVGALLVATTLGVLSPGFLARAARRLPPALARASALASGWSRGLARARNPGVLAGGLGLSLAMRAAEGAGMIMVQTALGLDLPLPATLVVLAAVALATMVPLAPANLGVYEGAAFWAYRCVGVDAENALALAALQHLAYLAAMGGAGWAAVTLGLASARSPAPRVPSASA